MAEKISTTTKYDGQKLSFQGHSQIKKPIPDSESAWSKTPVYQFSGKNILVIHH